MSKPKRCKSISQGAFNLRCTKPYGHEISELIETHQNRSVVWHGNGDAHRKPFVHRLIDPEALRGPVAGLKDTTFSVSFTPDPLGVAGDQLLKGIRDSFRIKDEAHLFKTSQMTGIRNEKPVTATPEQQLTQWWIQQAEDEVARTVPKAVEYSATDLTDIGHDLARTAGRTVSDEEAAELGVFFYLRGKMARWVGAVIAGERVSDDTLFDIGVYVRMAQRIREFGNWPGTEEPSCNHLGGHLPNCDQRGDENTPSFYPNRSAG